MRRMRPAAALGWMLGVATIGFLISSPVPARAAEADGADLVVTQLDGRTLLALGSEAPFHETSDAVLGARLIPVPDRAIRLAIWRERSAAGAEVPWFAVSLDGRTVSRVTATSYDLLLRYDRFDPLVRLPEVPARLAAGPSNHLWLVQFVTQPLEAFRETIRGLGGTVYAYVANHAHVVAMSPETAAAVASLPFVRWMGPYEPAFRLEEGLPAALAGKDPTLPHQRYVIQVLRAGRTMKDAVARRIAGLGGIVEKGTPQGYLLEVTLSAEQLRRVAGYDEVLWIDRWTPVSDDMNIVRQIGGADYIEAIAGFDGSGVNGEVLDSGCLVTHAGFQHHPPIKHGTVFTGSHGTNTSGIVFGDGTGNANGRGMLPNGQLITALYTQVTNRYQHTAELLQPPYEAVFQTNSWGSSQTPNYTTKSQEMDDIIFDLDILITQSQSNTGSKSSRPQAWAKNIVAVGGVYHYNTASLADDCWCGGASIGPATDGRVKPDLLHFYDSITTASSSCETCYTTTFGGTSAATPITVGHFGLFYEMWHAGLFGNLTGTSVFDSRPHYSTAKAVVINTAVPYPFTNSESDHGRNKQGWGLANVKEIYDRSSNMLIVNEEEVVANLSRWRYEVRVGTGSPDLRVTMHYPDPPGTTSSTQHRINDLTLTVTDPGGTVYYGNNGLWNGVWSTPGGVPNTIDTVENVFLQNPVAGLWTIDVSADELNQDGHVETPALDADFALVASGIQAYDLVHAATPAIQGQTMTLEVHTAQPGEAVLWLLSFDGVGSGPCLFGGQLCLDLVGTIYVLGAATADSEGVASLSLAIPAGSPPIPLHTQAFIIGGDTGSKLEKSNPLSDTIQ